MVSARRLYRLYLLLACAGATALVASLGAVGSTITFGSHPLRDWWAACSRLFVPKLSPAAVIVIAVLVVAAVGSIRGGSSLLRQLLAGRAYRKRLRIAGSARLTGGSVELIDDAAPLAFCAGYLRPRVYVSRGALSELSNDEIRAVLAHERHHAARRDPLRLLLARAVSEALFFFPLLRRATDRYAEVAELAADDAAVSASRDRGALASALLAFEERGSPDVVVGVAPERVDHLLGERVGWRLPVATTILSAVAGIALLVAAATAAGAAGAGTVDISMLFAKSCMLVMVGVPLLVILSARLTFRSKQRR